MTSDLEQGARNCAVGCAEAAPGRSVYIVSERDAVEPGVVDALSNAASTAGAEVQLLWSDPIPKDDPDKISEAVLGAYRNADIIISHFPSLKREALHPHFPSERRIRVPNRADTTELLSSAWARFPYEVQQSLAQSLDNRMKPDVSWEITSPAGTDIRGRFGSSSSVVGQAYFQQSQGNEGRARRNFPGGVHSPVMCESVNGVIVAEYVDGYGDLETLEKLEITIKDGLVTNIRGGDAVGRVRTELAKTDGFVDSWHAGVNPKTVVPVSKTKRPKDWFQYAHCSPRVLHFHLGRSHAPLNVGIFDHTILLDGEPIYENGKLLMPRDEGLRAVATRAKMAKDWLGNAELQLS